VGRQAFSHQALALGPVHGHRGEDNKQRGRKRTAPVQHGGRAAPALVVAHGKPVDACMRRGRGGVSVALSGLKQVAAKDCLPAIGATEDPWKTGRIISRI
jgi:hypothetical protein